MKIYCLKKWIQMNISSIKDAIHPSIDKMEIVSTMFSLYHIQMNYFDTKYLYASCVCHLEGGDVRIEMYIVLTIRHYINIDYHI